MFIPLHDGVALKHLRRATVTWTLIAALILIHVMVSSGIFGNPQSIDLALGLVPAVLSGDAVIGPDIALVPGWVTPLTSFFLHGSFWHLAGNLLFLWVFGDNVEDAMGSWRFLAFYIACGTLSGLLFFLVYPHSTSPLIGASGAISGVAAAYLLLYPQARIVGLLFNWIPVSIPAWGVLGFWVSWQILAALIVSDSHVGWWAHVGGIVCGAALLRFFKRPDVPWLGSRTQ